ncbi:MAG TPA: M28 family metallopeptidase [Pyrinomonadaceae bacterium]
MIRMHALLLRAALLSLAAACAAGCTTEQPAAVNQNTSPSPAAPAAMNVSADLKPAVESLTAADMLRHTTELSSDAYEGRGPGTKGEELTVKYLTEQFQRLGLKPGNPDGTYVQKAPLVGLKAEPTATLSAGGKEMALKFPDDYVAVTRRTQPDVKVTNSDVVFVGYGVVAPEYGWDDYKDVDVRGKTIVMLINDPAVTDPADASKPDEKMFKGKAMTYYGRWTYKYEIASAKGAAAAIIVHETETAGYGFEVVKSSWGRENFDIKSADGGAGRVGVESWITLDRAKELFTASGKNFDELKKAALTREFRPVALGAKANFQIKNTVREVQSQNVIARLEGSDPVLKDEYIVYTAHWDHLGRDESKQGDQIFNGAIDNASGTAMLLELAEAFTKLPTPPKRSVLFLAVTAEEKGLLGAKFYAENPLYPLAKTLANVNVDGVNQWGRTRDIVIIGLGNSTLDDLTQEVASLQSRVVKPDPEPEKGLFYRSDHFEFAKQGVPALYTDTGTDYVGKDPAFAMQKRAEYDKNDYHSPTDEVKPDWDLSGAVEDAQLLFVIGHRVAQGDKFPEWKPGAEFKAKREATLKK